MSTRTICEFAYVRLVLRESTFWVESIETGLKLDGIECTDMAYACKLARGIARGLDHAMRALAAKRATDTVLATLLASDLAEREGDVYPDMCAVPVVEGWDAFEPNTYGGS